MPAAPIVAPSAIRITPESRHMASPRCSERDFADYRLRLTLHFGGDAQEPAALHGKVGLERIDARLVVRHGCERRNHFAHRVWAHVDPFLHDDRLAHRLAGSLVLETHRHDDVVAFLDLRLYRLEHVIVGAGEHGTGQAHGESNGGVIREKFPTHFQAPHGWTIGDATRGKAELASRELRLTRCGTSPAKLSDSRRSVRRAGRLRMEWIAYKMGFRPAGRRRDRHGRKYDRITTEALGDTPSGRLAPTHHVVGWHRSRVATIMCRCDDVIRSRRFI